MSDPLRITAPNIQERDSGSTQGERAASKEGESLEEEKKQEHGQTTCSTGRDTAVRVWHLLVVAFT